MTAYLLRCFRNAVSVLAIASLVTSGSAIAFKQPAHSDPLAGAFGGAIIGGLITGRAGGAVAGAVIGGIGGAIYEEERQRSRARAYRRPVTNYRSSAHSAYRPSARQSSLVVEVQRSLTNLDYNPGPIDGIQGAGTSAAIRDYQRSNRLLVDGRASPQLLDHMRARGG